MPMAMQAFIFVGLMVLVIIGLFGWSWFELKSFKRALNHWKKGRPLKDILPIIYVPVVLMLALTLLFPSKAEASDFEYLQWFQVDAGLQYQLGDVPFVQCKEGDFDKLGSDIGLTLNVVEYQDVFEINSTYRHHSCAVGADTQIYDAIGLQVGWRFTFPW